MRKNQTYWYGSRQIVRLDGWYFIRRPNEPLGFHHPYRTLKQAKAKVRELNKEQVDNAPLVSPTTDLAAAQQ